MKNTFVPGYYYDSQYDELVIFYPDGSHDVPCVDGDFWKCSGKSHECYEEYKPWNLQFLGEL